MTKLKAPIGVRFMRVAFWLTVLLGMQFITWLLVGPWKFTFFAAALIVAVGLAVYLMRKGLHKARERYIREGEIPTFLKRKLRETYPHISGQQADQVEQGLRDYFLASLHHKNQFLAMPSQAVDVLWHEFILHTQAYRQWCHHGLGRFLDHTPAQAMGKRSTKRNDGLRRIWHWACKQENIDPRKPLMLPLLFAIDGQLAIADGFHYVPDCSGAVKTDGGSGISTDALCGTSFSSDSYSGSSADFGGAEGSSSGDSSDGSGSSSDGGSGDGGGSGCGGGGCGGGD